MQALIFGFMMPLLPLFVWRLYHREEALTAGRAIERYVIYTLLTTLFTTVVMVVACDDNISFMEKMDRLPTFVLKFVLTEAVAVALIILAEWGFYAKKIIVTIDREKYRNSVCLRFCRKILFPAGIFLLALLVIYLNSILINDNVVWGDEAYSGGAIRHDISGIFQILTLEENHPPLYYLWLKGFAEFFGYSTPVYHFASFIPFCLGIVLAVVFLRRYYGNIPAAFFVMISGLAAPCVEYNMEIRMYALAFLGIAGCYYSVSRIMSGSKLFAWVGMVFWALVAAYSHYYALVAAGIMIFAASVTAYLRYRGRVWMKGLLSLGIFCAAYAPWMSQVIRATKSVSGNWWMTEIEGIRSSLVMIGCGESMSKVVLPFLLLSAAVLFIGESSIFEIRKKEDKYLVQILPPSAGKWSDETYTIAVGVLTIIGTLAFAYGISVVMRPLIAVRYLYPLCAVTILMLVVCSHRILKILKEVGDYFHRNCFLNVGKCVLLMILAVLFVRGMEDYKAYKTLTRDENVKTAEVLSYIGEPDENTQFINNGILHIGWTVLNYYYPDTEVINGTYTEATADTVWYFTPNFLSEEQFAQVYSMGYSIPANYGEVQLGKYPFVLYCFTKVEPEETAQKKQGNVSLIWCYTNK